MHESDMWPERRWALFCSPHKNGTAEAKPFKPEKERNAWVTENPLMRQAVGQRHPVVKAQRNRWRAAWLAALKAWRQR